MHTVDEFLAANQILSNVDIFQENLPARPQDDVTLTCVLRGIASTDVEFFCVCVCVCVGGGGGGGVVGGGGGGVGGGGLIEETNSPIYIFSVRIKYESI